MFHCSILLVALQHLAETCRHEVVRSQARGALWILSDKQQMKSPSMECMDEAGILLR